MPLLAQQFFNHCKNERGFSANTLINYGSDVDQFEVFIGTERMDNREFDSSDARRFLVYTAGQGCSARTYNRKRCSLRCLFRFCGKPFQDVEHAKEEATIPEIINADEASRLVNNARTPFEKTVLALLYCCALRVSEIMSFGIHTDGKSLRVLGKGDKERIVPCPGWLLLMLDEKFFHTARGLSRYQVYRMVVENARASINKSVFPHMLRHSCATHMMQGGADMRVIQEFLGHESVETTQIYTKVDIRHLQEVVREFHPRA